MGSCDVKDNSSVVTLCNTKDVGTMKKREKERKKATSFYHFCASLWLVFLLTPLLLGQTLLVILEEDYVLFYFYKFIYFN